MPRMTAPAVRRIRRGLGLTQAELAKRLGVTRNTVARWEIGVRPVSPTAAILLGMLAKKGRTP